MDVRRDDLVGNLARSARVEHDRAVAKLGGPVDRGEWFMTPQTVNAYFNPPMNTRGHQSSPGGHLKGRSRSRLAVRHPCSGRMSPWPSIRRDPA